MKRLLQITLVALLSLIVTACSFTLVSQPVHPVQQVETLEQVDVIVSDDGKGQIKCEEGESLRGQSGAWIYIQRLVGNQWVDVVDPHWDSNCEASRVWARWIQKTSVIAEAFDTTTFSSLNSKLFAMWNP